MLCFPLPARVIGLVWVSRSADTAYRGDMDASWSVQPFRQKYCSCNYRCHGRIFSSHYKATTDKRSNSNEAATFSYSIRQSHSRGPPRFAPTGRLPNFSSIASAPAAPILEAALLSNNIPAFEPFWARRKPTQPVLLLRQRSTSPHARRHLPLWLS